MKQLFLLTLTLLILFFTNTNQGYAQLQEGLSLSHSYFPKDESIGIQKSEIGYFTSFGLNEQGSSILLGGHYTFSLFDFDEDKYPAVSTSKLEEFHTLSLQVGYRTSIGADWTVMGLVMPYFSSTLNDDFDLQRNDFGVDGIIMFTKGNPASYLTLGLAYSTQSGLPFPIPIISYHNTINKSWDYTLGVPQFDLNFHATSRSSFQSFIKLDGVMGNIRESVLADYPGVKSQFAQYSIIGGLGYNFKLSKSISLSVEGGYTLGHFLFIQKNEIKIPPKELYDFDTDNKLYLNAGLRIGI